MTLRRFYRTRWPILAARVRLLLLVIGLAMLLLGSAVQLGPLGWVGLAAVLAGIAMMVRFGTVHRVPVTVEVPLSGPWTPVNSPGSRVPSHGIHGYGQTYAIDLVHDLPDGAGPSVRWWPLAAAPQSFSGFGQPVTAAAAGTVVRVHDRERDHWSRNSWPALVYLFGEGLLRELTGVSRILGNHVVVDHGDGVFAVYAHLRRGSSQASVGDNLTAGQLLGEVGNSGNSSEPHLHFQLMDRPSPYLAAGLPFVFGHYEVEGRAHSGVPANRQRFIARGTPRPSARASDPAPVR